MWQHVVERHAVHFEIYVDFKMHVATITIH